MHTPSQEQWQKVIDTLKSVLPMAKKEGNLNMDYGIVNGESCGTICCVAGWYMVAKTNPDRVDLLKNDDWILGKRAIAQDLGFETGEFLKQWADNNPQLWGNTDGYGMFMDAYAYTSGVLGARAETLSDVIAHFEFVKNNCNACANEKSMADGDR